MEYLKGETLDTMMVYGAVVQREQYLAVELVARKEVLKADPTVPMTAPISVAWMEI